MKTLSRFLIICAATAMAACAAARAADDAIEDIVNDPQLISEIERARADSGAEAPSPATAPDSVQAIANDAELIAEIEAARQDLADAPLTTVPDLGPAPYADDIVRRGEEAAAAPAPRSGSWLLWAVVGVAAVILLSRMSKRARANQKPQ